MRAPPQARSLTLQSRAIRRRSPIPTLESQATVVPVFQASRRQDGQQNPKPGEPRAVRPGVE